MVSRDEFEAATARGKARRSAAPAATSAHYDRDADRVVVTLTNGAEIAFAPAMAEGLRGASAESLVAIEVSPSGFGLHFPALDADLDVPELVEGALGSRKWMAVRKDAADAEPAQEDGRGALT
jgi:hypothetical protein